MKKNKIIFALFLLSLVGRIGLGQDAYYKQYAQTDGLPSMTTYEIVQDSNGILWIGTENGLVSFDGEVFERYTHPELNDNDIINLNISAEGYPVFSNLSNQLCYVKNKEVKKISDLSKNNRYVLFSSKSENYLYEFSSFDDCAVQKILNYSLKDSLNIQEITNLELLRDNDVMASNNPFWNNPKYSIYYGYKNDELVLYSDLLPNEFLQNSEIEVNQISSRNLADHQYLHLA